MPKMLGHYLEVNTTVQQERSIAMPELVQCKIFKLRSLREAFQRVIYGVSVTIVTELTISKSLFSVLNVEVQ